MINPIPVGAGDMARLAHMMQTVRGRLPIAVLTALCLAALAAGPAHAAPGDRDAAWNGGNRLDIASPAFSPATSTRDTLFATVTDGSGRTYVGGVSRQIQSNSTIESFGYVTRLTTSGAIDASWGTNGFANARSFSGKPVVQGLGFDTQGRLHATLHGTAIGTAARYTSNGTLDGGYGSGGTATVGPPPNDGTRAWELGASAVGRDGSTYFAFRDRQAGGSSDYLYVMRIDPNGNPDATYNAAGERSVPFEQTPGGAPPPLLAEVDAQGRLYVGRSIQLGGVGGPARAEIRRFTSAGAPDTGWSASGVWVDGGNTAEAIRDLELTANGGVVYATLNPGASVHKLGSSGFVESSNEEDFSGATINPSADSVMVAEQSDRKIVAVTRVGTTLDIRRWDLFADLDPEFNGDGVATDPNFPQFPFELGITTAGKLNVVGGFGPAYAARYLLRDPALTSRRRPAAAGQRHVVARPDLAL